MTRPHSGTALAAVDDPAPDCATLRDCLHCSVRHLAVCSALTPDEVQALERVTVSQPLPLGATLARAGEPRLHV